MATAPNMSEILPSKHAATVRRILLVAPSPPPYGGMALQARQLTARLKQDGNLVEFLASNFEFSGKLKFVERLPVIRTAARAALIWVLLWRRMRSVDIVHILAASWLYFFLVVSPAVLVGRLRGKRVIVNYRGGEADRFFRTWGWLAKRILRSAHVVTAPSNFLGEVILRRLDVSVTIVPNILDTQRFRFRARHTLQPKMLVTRHLEEIYGVEAVIRAFRHLQEKRPDATLWIAGTGSQRSYLECLVAEWKLRGVEFLGHVPHENLPGIYEQCDIFLNGSTVDNFPGALIEASAAGLVVISTGAGGIPYIYTDSVNALLVKPGEWQELAAAANRVLDNPLLAVSLVREASAMVRQYDWRHVSEALYQAYGERGTSECTAG